MERVDLVEVAGMVRAELKKAWPGTKFGVCSKRYSGGASIHVEWMDGPTAKAVEARVGHLGGATFDPMIDLKGYAPSTHDGQTFQSGADWIMCERQCSAGFLRHCARIMAKRYGLPEPAVIEDQYGARYDETEESFWQPQRNGGPAVRDLLWRIIGETP